MSQMDLPQLQGTSLVVPVMATRAICTIVRTWISGWLDKLHLLKIYLHYHILTQERPEQKSLDKHRFMMKI